MNEPTLIGYLAVRRAVGITGIVLPVVLCVGGLLSGEPLLASLSDYYHTPMRDIL